MTEVRRYKRRSVSGKTVTVRQHYRDTGDGGGERERAAQAQRAESSRVPHVSELPPSSRPADGEDWWDDSEPQQEAWMDASKPEPEMSDSFRAMVAQNPSLSEGFGKLKVLRDAGYDGPVDQDGNPASRKALFKARRQAARDQDEAHHRFCYARTIPERDAAERDFEAAKAKLRVLPGALDKLDG